MTLNIVQVRSIGFPSTTPSIGNSVLKESRLGLTALVRELKQLLTRALPTSLALLPKSTQSPQLSVLDKATVLSTLIVTLNLQSPLQSTEEDIQSKERIWSSLLEEVSVNWPWALETSDSGYLVMPLSVNTVKFTTWGTEEWASLRLLETDRETTTK